MPAAGRRGFTLIEMLLVVVIIGILAVIAIPKFKSTTDQAMLASVRADVHNAQVAEEAYFSDKHKYANLNQLKNWLDFSISPGNTMKATGATDGYTVTATNSSIQSKIKHCTVQVGAGATVGVDGVISCY